MSGEKCPNCGSILYYVNYLDKGYCRDCKFTIDLTKNIKNSNERCPECESILYKTDIFNKNKCPECGYENKD